MRINILSVANKPPNWVSDGAAFYEKRLAHQFPIQWTDIDLNKIAKTKNPNQANKQQADVILKKIPHDDHVIALAIKGKTWSTDELAQQFANWLASGKNLSFLIGGPDGLDESCIKRANQAWSLSKLTFPHQLVKIILLEQLYRAVTLLHNHPYHR